MFKGSNFKSNPCLDKLSLTFVCTVGVHEEGASCLLNKMHGLVLHAFGMLSTCLWYTYDVLLGMPRTCFRRAFVIPSDMSVQNPRKAAVVQTIRPTLFSEPVGITRACRDL